MSTLPVVMDRQYPLNAPTVDGTAEGTNLVLPPIPVRDRLRHFPINSYSLESDSHLYRFMAVLLGDAGIGGVRKRMLFARLQQTLSGSSFIDLDRFYGALFSVRRRSLEALTIDPASLATAEEWAEQYRRDASYRSRVGQFSKALSYGGTSTAMELVAESLLSVDCDVYESWVTIDRQTRSWGDVEAAVGTWGYADLYRFGELESVAIPDASTDNRGLFTIRPRRAVTLEEKYDVLRVVRAIKPVFSRAIVDAEGIALHHQADIAAVTADSEYWDIRTEVVPDNDQVLDLYPQADRPGVAVGTVRPPFSEYQGESWSYNADIIGVVGYSETAGQPPVVVPGSDRTRVYYYRDQASALLSYIDFTPGQALKSPQMVSAGRAATDGVTVIHAYDRLPSTVSGTEGSVYHTVGAPDLTSDGIPVTAKATEMQWGQVTAPDTGTRLWATADRSRTDMTREIVELRYPSLRFVNTFSFELSRFPLTVGVEYFDADRGQWVRFYSTTLMDSVPSRLNPGQPPLTPSHPEHSDPHHWIRIAEKMTNISTSRIRFVMNRTSMGTAPVDVNGTAVPYSLAIRNIDVGFTISALEDIPRSAQAIAQTRDAYGSVKTMYFHEERADGLLRGDEWRSQPQPVSDAVVNLYLDLRVNNDGQVIDRFYLDPLYSGSHLSLYWSNDEPLSGGRALGPTRWTAQAIVNNPGTKIVPSSFVAPTDTISPSALSGTIEQRSDGILFGNGGPAYIDLPLEGTDFRPTEDGDWWIAFRVRLSAGWNALTDTKIASWGNSTLVLHGTGSVEFTVGGQGVTTTLGSPPPPNGTIVVGVDHSESLGRTTVIAKVIDPLPADPIGFDEEDEFKDQYPDWYRNKLRWYHTYRTAVPHDTEVTSLRLGDPDLAGDFTLVSFAAKANRSLWDWIPIADEQAVVSFEVDSGPDLAPVRYTNSGLWNDFELIQTSNFGDDYVTEYDRTFLDTSATPPEMIANRPSLFYPYVLDNTVLRFAAGLRTADNPWGFTGGRLAPQDSVGWHPIPRDFTVEKGYIQIPPTKAKFFKFEFTNLSPVPYESFTSIMRTLKTFPKRLGQPNTSVNGATAPNRVPGAPSQIELLSQYNSYRFRDTYYLPPPEGPQGGMRTPVSSLFIENYELAKNLASQSNVWGMRPVGQSPNAPRFVADAFHFYQTQFLAHADKVAFFIGLKELKAFRIDYVADDDTLQYRDLFYDDVNFYDPAAPSTWQQDPNRLYTPAVGGGVPATATSKVFWSAHDLVGLQYATHQNDPAQILPDDEFRDPTLMGSRFDDLALWHGLGDAVVSYSPMRTTVRVQRSPTGVVHPTIFGLSDLGMEQPPLHPVFASDIEAGGASGDTVLGGLESPLVAISAAGRIHAAVRFTAVADLTAPLFLEIITGDGSVLASKEIRAKAGVTMEESVSYLINSYVPRYQEVDSPFSPRRTLTDDTVHPPFDDTLSRIAPPPPPPEDADNSVRVRIVQYGPTTDTWVLDALSLFDESIVWEFSNDGGNTWLPGHGIRNFVNGTLFFPRPGNQLRWRVTGYRPNMNITSVQIRPIYKNRLNLRTAVPYRGPNVSVYDHEPPIQDDPEFSTWSKPVPRTWYLAGKPFFRLPIDAAIPQNEYSLHYGRSVAEDVSGLTETPTRLVVSYRFGYHHRDRTQLPQEIPETLPIPGDTAVRTGIFHRDTIDGVRSPTDRASAFLIPGNPDPIDRPPMSPPSG